MTLKDRAAAALDRTHEPGLAYRGPMTMKVRHLVADWLDGRKVRKSLIRRGVDYLEMIGGAIEVLPRHDRLPFSKGK